jgi:hypothetical protein
MLLILIAAAFAQSGYRLPFPPATPVIPRTTTGKPDISGLWITSPSAALAGNITGPAGYGDNGPGDHVEDALPFSELGRKTYQERIRTQAAADPSARCMPPGVPRVDYTIFPFRIIALRDRLVILYEAFNGYRQIFLDGRAHDAQVQDSWNGDSVGHWEDDTLVVDTVGLTGRSWLDWAGHPVSGDLHVTERFERVDATNLTIDITIDDPKMYTQPFAFLVKAIPEAGELMEYVCQENETDSRHMIADPPPDKTPKAKKAGAS